MIVDGRCWPLYSPSNTQDQGGRRVGQKVTLAIKGTLQLSIDGSPTKRPLDVSIPSLEIDLDHLMERGALTLRGDKVDIQLTEVTLRLTLDADAVLSRGESAIVTGLEEMK